MFKKIKKSLIIAPHPDDEVLGVGGTISRMIASNIYVHVIFMGGHLPPIYKRSEYENTKIEAMGALKKLGCYNYTFIENRATYFNKVDLSEFNKPIETLIKKIKPNLVFIPFPDRHLDHKVTFEASMVATRPIDYVKPYMVLSYEVLSETHWNASGIESNFVPDFFVDIGNYYIKKKCEALKMYKSQIKGNLARSVDAIKSLSKFRGSQANLRNAEAFKVIRQII